MIQAAIVGLGTWGQHLVSAFHGKSDAIRFTAGATRTPQKAADFCRTHGIRLVSNYDELLKEGSIDAVVLATPHSTHAEQIAAAVTAPSAAEIARLLRR